MKDQRQKIPIFKANQNSERFILEGEGSPKDLPVPDLQQARKSWNVSVFSAKGHRFLGKRTRIPALQGETGNAFGAAGMYP